MTRCAASGRTTWWCARRRGCGRTPTRPTRSAGRARSTRCGSSSARTSRASSSSTRRWAYERATSTAARNGAPRRARSYVPELKVSRLTALNTGLQGGFGRGDSIEVVFNIRTDRAGSGAGRDAHAAFGLDRFLGFSRGLGDAADAYSARVARATAR